MIMSSLPKISQFQHFSRSAYLKREMHLSVYVFNLERLCASLFYFFNLRFFTHYCALCYRQFECITVGKARFLSCRGEESDECSDDDVDPRLFILDRLDCKTQIRSRYIVTKLA